MTQTNKFSRRRALVMGTLIIAGTAIPRTGYCFLDKLAIPLIHFWNLPRGFRGLIGVVVGVPIVAVGAGLAYTAYKFLFDPVDRKQVSSSTTYDFKYQGSSRSAQPRIVTPQEEIIVPEPPSFGFAVSSNDPLPLDILSIRLAPLMFAPDRARLNDDGGWVEIEPNGIMHFRDTDFEGHMVCQNNNLSIWDSAGGLVVTLAKDSQIEMVTCENSESAQLALAALAGRRIS